MYTQQPHTTFSLSLDGLYNALQYLPAFSTIAAAAQGAHVATAGLQRERETAIAAKRASRPVNQGHSCADQGTCYLCI